MGCKVLPPQSLRGWPDASENIFENGPKRIGNRLCYGDFYDIHVAIGYHDVPKGKCLGPWLVCGRLACLLAAPSLLRLGKVARRFGILHHHAGDFGSGAQDSERAMMKRGDRQVTRPLCPLFPTCEGADMTTTLPPEPNTL